MNDAFWAALSPLHPRFVHFPIALFTLAVALSFLSAWRPLVWLGMRVDQLAFFALVAGWLLSAPAILTGLIDQNLIPLDAPARAVSDNHITAIIAAWVAFGLAIYTAFRATGLPATRPARWRYLVLLLIGFVALVIGGELGGQLVYEFRVGVR